MKLKTLLVLLLTLTLLTVGMTGATAQSSESASLRFVHVIPSLQNIDIYVNGSLSVEGLGFGTGSTYLTAPAGALNVRVTLAGLTTTLWEQTVNAAASEAVTLVASTTEPLAFDEYREDLSALAFGASRLTILHAIAGGPAVDVQIGGPNIAPQTIISGLAYKSVVGPSQPPANSYVVTVLTTDGAQPILQEKPFNLAAGTSNFVVVYGTPSAPQTLQLTKATLPDGDTGLVRFVHGIPGAPAADILVNDTLIVPAVPYGGASEHIALPAGEHTVTLRQTGAESGLATQTITVNTGEASTVAALNVEGDGGIGLVQFADDVSGVTNRSVVIALLNTIPDSAGVSISADGETLIENVAPGETASAALATPFKGTLTVDVSFGEAAATADVDALFYGGVYYNGIVSQGEDGPVVVFVPTSLAQAVDSAPSAVEAVVAQPTPAPTTDTSSEVVAATPAPSTDVVPAATPAPSTTLPTARIAVDPGANLQLREYPNSDARSLGLAAGGSSVTVNGRQGAPVDINGNVITLPDGTEFVDLAEGLDKNQDIEPSSTWLNVSFVTGDGGTITAWVNAFYLDVRAPDGTAQRLADLPTIPLNRPGALQNTQATPPPVTQDTVTVEVFNLNQGTNLNIRRTANTDGEVLARVGNGTQLEFIGLGASGEWVFVGYRPAEGGRITGWASQLYLRYIWRGQVAELSELAERNLLVTIDETRIGEVSADAPPPVQPTVDPLKDAYVAFVQLDPGANLNLRRTPNDQAEVLARIPSASQIVVTSRTADGLWLSTTFEGVSGWVSSRFVTLTFNGRPVTVEEVPVDAAAPADALPPTTPTGGSVG